ncbi:GtrA family protein [Variovorax sp. J22R133]|uniref:GtrA family protein n=1 Tax=Variovorax brevis TaxID=3053503 RepID=UPI002575DA61|nr:GtrA family protein [Variovorax sp. J22R133]MDM0113952.1 GtrA family protein [Variovorax sp. J22R133]
MTHATRTPAHVVRFLRYLAVGGLNTAFGFAVYGALIVVGAPIWLALLLANVAGIGFNFFTTGTLVFRASLRGRLVRFVGAYACIYGVNLLLLALVRQWVQGEILAQALLALPMAAFAYVLIHRFVFTDAPGMA